MRILFYTRGVESLGVEYIMSYLEQQGHAVELLFDPGLDNNLYYHLGFLKPLNRWGRLRRRALAWKPDLVAFSVISNVYQDALAFARSLKPHLEVPFLFGGIHPTALPEYVLQNPEIDYVCRGEGEQMMAELVDCLEKGQSVQHIRNLCYRDGKQIRVNPLRPLIEDLDSLPFPKREPFYREGAFRSLLHVITARGCPFQCAYCVNSFLKNKLYREYAGHVPFVRRRSPGNVIQEILECTKQYPVDHIYFCDEVFITGKEWLFQFLELFKQHVHGVTFSFSYHHRFIDEEVARRLSDAGAVFAQGAIETANGYLRKNVLKRIETDEDLLRPMRLLQAHGVKVATSAIFGIPHETEESRWETVRLVEKSKPDMINTYLMYPFPGTEITEMALRDGFLSEEGLEQSRQGQSGIHQSSLFKNLDSANAETMAKLLPLYIMGPRFLKPLIRALMKRRLPRFAHALYLVTTPFVYSGWARKWIVNLLRMFVYQLPGASRRRARTPSS